MRETFEEVVPNIVREVVARHGGRCGIAAISDALARAGRFERERASAAFARSARSWGDSLDSYDHRDRVHTGRFVDAWEREVAERIGEVPDPGEPVAERSSLESRAVTASFQTRIATRELLTESMLIDAAIAFGRREWVLAMIDTARAARRAFEDMERLNVHGNLLSWLAESYDVVTGGAVDR